VLALNDEHIRISICEKSTTIWMLRAFVASGLIFIAEVTLDIGQGLLCMLKVVPSVNIIIINTTTTIDDVISLDDAILIGSNFEHVLPLVFSHSLTKTSLPIGTP